MFNKLLKSLVLCLGIMYGYSQNYNMTNGTTITTCSGTFYDSGGPTGNYGNAESMVYTICPPSNTNSIQIAFTEMNLENNVDILYVYDGDQIGAPLLYTFTGTDIPTVFQATGNNPSGCLTFRFTSDTYNNAQDGQQLFHVHKFVNLLTQF